MPFTNSGSDDSFCGGSTFWNTTAIRSSSYPKLSECFQQTALTFIPCGWLWLTAGFHIGYLRRHTRVISLPMTWLHTARLFVALTLGLASGIHLFLPLEEDQRFPASFFVSQSLWLITYLLACILMVYSRICGVMSPCVIVLFWLLTTVSHIVPIYSVIIQEAYHHALMRFAIELVTFALILIEFALHLAGDIEVHLIHATSYKDPCPVMSSSFISKLTYSWMFRLLYQGFRSTLVLKDIFDLPGYMQSRNNVPAFMDAWNQEFSKRTDLRHNKYQIGHPFSINGKDVIIPNYQSSTDGKTITPTQPTKGTCHPQPAVLDNASKIECQQGKTPSLIRALVKVFCLPLLKAQVVGVMADALLYANPLLLGRLISYIEAKDERPKWEGYALAASFFAVVLTSSVLSSYRFYTCTCIGDRVKTVLAAAVYKKSLTMNAEGRRNFTVGNVVNLMTVDCQRFRDLITKLYALFSWPVQISIAFFLLYNVLGIAFVAGIITLLLLMPTNAKLTTSLKGIQIRQMALKDQRIKLVNEILNGIKVLKLYAWEPSFQKKILEVRRHEVLELRKAAVLNSINSLCWVISPVLVTVTSFVAYVLITGDSLTPSKAFVAMSVIHTMKAPMDTLPALISQIVQCQVSLKRLHKYLTGGDLDEADSGQSSDDFPIQVKEATLTWDRTTTPVLQNITMSIPRGKLVAVVGPVGAGKSSLLSAALGEMEQLTGQRSMSGQAAFVPQQAWIQNMTLQNNILFEKPLEEDFYTKVIEACALEADIELLPDGDQTEIGEKGINLSGGQRQRVSLARAVYQDADVYLLDDPLSAVDAQVGRHIFQNVIGPHGIIRDKTRLMVTHGVHWLPLVDIIIVMDHGKITETGTYEELMNRGGHFSHFVRNFLLENQDEDVQEPDVLELPGEIKDDAVRGMSQENQSGLHTRHIQNQSIRQRQRKKHEAATGGDTLCDKSISPNGATETPPKAGTTEKRPKPLIDEEKVQKGQIRKAVFSAMLRAFGYLPVIVACFFLIFYNGANVASGLWLSEWTNDDYLKNETYKGTGKYTSDTYRYLGVYSVLALTQVLGNGVFVMLVFVQMVTASQRLHNLMLNSILHQSMVFFDTTPAGRILNRFSRDVDIMDVLIGRQLWMAVFTGLNMSVTLIIISYSTPLFLAVLPPIVFIYILFQRFYIRSSRQFRRLESTSRSPILSHFTDTIHGAGSIRAYGVGRRFYSQFQDSVDNNLRCTFVTESARRWLKVRLEFLSSVMVFFACLFAVTSHGVSASLVGLSITYALQITESLNQLIQHITMLETNSVSCERLVEYINLPHEPEWVQPDRRPPPGWPARGRIAFHGYSTRYRPHLDVVLRDITFTVEAGQKIGVVGRTGAGKSSLSVALFRMIEASGGSILIDDVDVSTIGLHDLRAGLTILPQDPVLFSGTVRFNLDPIDLHSDAALWEALDYVHLGTCLREWAGQLEYVCEENGQNLSVGQRQLMCLARSLLRKTRILVLDEATAAVDLETDALLQDTIREAFRDCTVLTVAHRLNTVIDYDKILVLGNGEILEYGDPGELLADTSGAFYNLAKESGLVP
ncbi:hypothetical protein RRG08_064629 [Elysia crispata]|uniref:ABC-type glutathione-S-conjugate transporter n=1 Tax=Elysia crispata TaxID=231223 RepID=A0AAE1EC30_9GAST|nr:hypothetical protein RRG08_064629 [Elysia crispata]